MSFKPQNKSVKDHIRYYKRPKHTKCKICKKCISYTIRMLNFQLCPSCKLKLNLSYLDQGKLDLMKPIFCWDVVKDFDYKTIVHIHNALIKYYAKYRKQKEDNYWNRIKEAKQPLKGRSTFEKVSKYGRV